MGVSIHKSVMRSVSFIRPPISDRIKVLTFQGIDRDALIAPATVRSVVQHIAGAAPVLVSGTWEATNPKARERRLPHRGWCESSVEQIDTELPDRSVQALSQSVSA
jgi:hypothetical protein